MNGSLLAVSLVAGIFLIVSLVFLLENVKLRRDNLNLRHDIARLKDEYSKLKTDRDCCEKQAWTDPLTGLLNRRGFKFSSQQAIDVIERQEGHKDVPVPVAALTCDIDWFKRVNDTFGHSAGDEVLVAVAQCLKNRLRSTDIVCRLGGDEIVALMLNTSLEQATQKAEEICREVSQLRFPGKDLTITISCGVSYGQLKTVEETTSLLEQADAALYLAKENGRDRVAVSDDL